MRRLPFPEFPPVHPDPLGPCPHPTADVVAERWARWHAERTGVAWPSYSKAAVDWETDGQGACYCVVAVLHAEETRRTYRRSRRRGSRAYVADGWETTPAHREELLRLPVPPWAMPVKRLDLWQRALDEGAGFDEALAEGRGYGPRNSAERLARYEKFAANRQARWAAEYAAYDAEAA